MSSCRKYYHFLREFQFCGLTNTHSKCLLSFSPFFLLLACFLLLSHSPSLLLSLSFFFSIFHNCCNSGEYVLLLNFIFISLLSLSIFSYSHMLIGYLDRLFCEVPFQVQPSFLFYSILFFFLIDKQEFFIYSDNSLVRYMYCKIFGGDFGVCISKFLIVYFHEQKFLILMKESFMLSPLSG